MISLREMLGIGPYSNGPLSIAGESYVADAVPILLKKDCIAVFTSRPTGAPGEDDNSLIGKYLGRFTFHFYHEGSFMMDEDRDHARTFAGTYNTLDIIVAPSLENLPMPVNEYFFELGDTTAILSHDMLTAFALLVKHSVEHYKYLGKRPLANGLHVDYGRHGTAGLELTE